MSTGAALGVALELQRFLDYEVADIPDRFRQSLASLPQDWLASSDFALLYSFPPAERVWMDVDPTGVVQRAYYYSEKWERLGKRIVLHGPADMTVAEARQLLGSRGAARLDVLLMAVPRLAGERPDATHTASTLFGEDVVVNMPPTAQELLASLGSNKRQQLGKYTRRLEREWPGKLEWLCLSKREISEELFQSVVQFNIQRQSAKGKQTLWDTAVMRQRWQLARRTGLLCGIRLCGQLVAGGVACLHGGDAYFVLIGHHPAYDYWNLGNLTTWLTMEKCLDRGVQRFHFLWGVSEYKQRFGGEIKPLYTVSVFRNHPLRMISALADSLPAWKRSVLAAARNLRMMVRNSQFGRLILAPLRALRRRGEHT